MPLATGVYNRQVNKSTSSNNDNIAMDVNPAYDDFTSNTDEDASLEYEVMEPQCRQIKTDDITMVRNPAYAETKFT